MAWSGAPKEEVGFPYGDAELEGFEEWFENDPATDYGPHFLNNHPGDGPNGHDDVTEQILEKAKIEFKAGRVQYSWEMKRASNVTEWRRCIRENLDISKCQSEEDHLVRCFQIPLITGAPPLHCSCPFLTYKSLD